MSMPATAATATLAQMERDTPPLAAAAGIFLGVLLSLLLWACFATALRFA